MPFSPSLQAASSQLQNLSGHMDEKLQSLLQQLRNGTLPLSSLRSAATPTSPSAAAPMIVSTNAEANSENQRRLDELPGEVRVFKAKDWTEKSKTEGPLTLEVEKVGFWGNREVFFEKITVIGWDLGRFSWNTCYFSTSVFCMWSSPESPQGSFLCFPFGPRHEKSFRKPLYGEGLAVEGG